MRAQAHDFLHNFRFHVAMDNVNNQNYLALNDNSAANAEAGFATCTAPSVTTEAVMYREGQYIFTRKQPGQATYSDVTLTRGVTRAGSGFYDWASTIILGRGDYRTNLTIRHFHRGDTHPGFTPGQTYNPLFVRDAPARVYTLFNAFPVSFKPTTDLAGTESSISVQEIGIAYEYFTVTPPGVELPTS